MAYSKQKIMQSFEEIIDKIKKVKTWQLVIILVLLGFLVMNFLRLNHAGMFQMREAVLVADKSGDDEVLRSRLYDLQRYAATHMNADTGQFNLKAKYERDFNKSIDDTSNIDEDIRYKVDKVCRARYPSYAVATHAQYVQCFVEELDKYPGRAPDLPNPLLYKQSFSSPLWSPDFAGFSVIAFGIVFLIIIGRLFRRLLLLGILKIRKAHFYG